MNKRGHESDTFHSEGVKRQKVNEEQDDNFIPADFGSK